MHPTPGLTIAIAANHTIAYATHHTLAYATHHTLAAAPPHTLAAATHHTLTTKLLSSSNALAPNESSLPAAPPPPTLPPEAPRKRSGSKPKHSAMCEASVPWIGAQRRDTTGCTCTGQGNICGTGMKVSVPWVGTQNARQNRVYL